MGRKLIGEPADLAPTHCVRLAGQGQRTYSSPADPSGDEMTVDYRIDLIGTGRRLVHTLGIERDGPFGDGEPVIKIAKVGSGNIGDCCSLVERGGASQCRTASTCMTRRPSIIARSVLDEIPQ
jgi:hypothetical protein